MRGRQENRELAGQGGLPFPEQRAPLCIPAHRSLRGLWSLPLLYPGMKSPSRGWEADAPARDSGVRAQLQICPQDPWGGGERHVPGPSTPCPVPHRTAGPHAHLPGPEAGVHPELHEGREADVSVGGRLMGRASAGCHAAGVGLFLVCIWLCRVAHTLCSSQQRD